MSSFLRVLTFNTKHCFYPSGVVCIQGPSHMFLIPELRRHVHFPSNFIMQDYSKRKIGKGSSKPINSSRIK